MTYYTKFIFVVFIVLIFGGLSTCQYFTDTILYEQTEHPSQENDPVEEDDCLITAVLLSTKDLFPAFSQELVYFYESPNLGLIQRPPRNTH